MSARGRLTPQMRAYGQKFADDGDIRWLPYLHYFHPAAHRSAVVATDRCGFRYSESAGVRYSVADPHPSPRVRLLAGSSTVFGIGASADAATLPSRMTVRDERPQPWVNFGGRSFNSTQELLLLTLYRHLLPAVDEIVLLSGFNNLGLARLPATMRGEHGAFFNCATYFDAFGVDACGTSVRRASVLDRVRGRRRAGAQRPPDMEEQLGYAADLTLRHLDAWRALAADSDARLTFVLQPLSGWVRPTGSPEEELLFAELDAIADFTGGYGDILDREVHREYARRIAEGAAKLDVGFVDLSPVLAASITPEQWVFVDRIHFTDAGHDHVAGTLLELLGSG